MKELLKMDVTMRAWAFMVVVFGALLIAIPGTMLSLHYMAEYYVFNLITNWCGFGIGFILLILPIVFKSKLITS